MDESLAKNALDQISELDLAEKVTFHVMGEPLLHPRFFSILDHAHEKKINVGLTTNGALLTTRIIDELARRDLHQIDISLQTPDEKSFMAARGRAMNFDQYRTNLLKLLAECFARENPPIFKIRMMITRFAEKMRGKLGIPDFMGNSGTLRRAIHEWVQLIYQQLNMGDPDSRLLARLNKIGIHGWNVIEVSPKIFIETYVLTDWGNAFAGNGIIEARHGYCFGMRDHFAILYSGDMVLCCIDYDGRTAIGNLKNKSLIEILKSSELQEILKGFRWLRLEHPYCRKCLGSSNLLSSWTKPIASVVGLKLLKPLFYRKYRLFE